MNGPPPSARGGAGAPVRSLRWRLLAATLVALVAALALAGVLLAELFRSHVMRQSVAMLTAQLDQVTARLEFDADGRPAIDPGTLSDPRWSRPQSGLYWQLDSAGAGAPLRGVLRSRSLWDATLALPADESGDAEVHVHELAGPRGELLVAVERSVRAAGAGGAGVGPGVDGDRADRADRTARTDRTDRAGGDGAGGGPAAARWRLVVAVDLTETRAAIDRFDGVLAASLAGLLVLLAAAGWAQVAVGLAPLRSLKRALAAVHEGRASRLEGPVPAEVQPLVDDFNAVLQRNAELVERARTQAGNLAHALKTPLAVLRQAAAAARPEGPSAPSAPAAPAAPAAPWPEPVAAPQPASALVQLPALVLEQVDKAERQVGWHLARARAAAAQGRSGPAAVDVAPLLDGLVRVMQKVHAGRGLALALEATPADAPCRFAGAAEDLQEIAGNVLDNACKWARTRVQVAVTAQRTEGTARLVIDIDDDGPGIAAADRASVLARGARLDETVPGSGLGLAIADELVRLYGGTLELADAPGGGLRVRIGLPAAS